MKSIPRQTLFEKNLLLEQRTMPISSRLSARALAPDPARLRELLRPASRRHNTARTAAEPQQQPDTPPPSSSTDEVAAAFARLVAAADPKLVPPPRSPSPLHSPTTVSRALCYALQRPDSPEPGSGARVAFDLTLPLDVAPAAPVLAGAGRRARSWHAKEAFLGFDSFVADSVSAPPSDVFEDCEYWELVGDLTFTGRGSVSGIGDCSKAAQAVSIVATDRRSIGEKSETSGKTDKSGKNRKYTATILLTRVDVVGPWRGCWMVYGMRTGNYCSL